ncbi:MAG: Holliday junction resolvase RuvX, partial [Bacteroidota bacterium]|nr:Holliday junction resolvase RuvX [Bacteroidota bacterium]
SNRILGIDFGSVRIGIAISDPIGIIAQGITVIQNSPNAFDEIKEVIEQYHPVKIVIGMPLNLKGEKGKKAEEVEIFVKELENRFHLEVILADERFTSKIAHRLLQEFGVKKKKRREKERIDKMAAALILQGYLDGQHRK